MENTNVLGAVYKVLRGTKAMSFDQRFLRFSSGNRSRAATLAGALTLAGCASLTHTITVEVSNPASAKSVGLEAFAQIGPAGDTWSTLAVEEFNSNWEQVIPDIYKGGKINAVEGDDVPWLQPRCVEIPSKTEQMRCIFVVPAYSTLILRVATDKYEVIDSYAINWHRCGDKVGSACRFQNVSKDQRDLKVDILKN